MERSPFSKRPICWIVSCLFFPTLHRVTGFPFTITHMMLIGALTLPLLWVLWLNGELRQAPGAYFLTISEAFSWTCFCFLWWCFDRVLWSHFPSSVQQLCDQNTLCPDEHKLLNLQLLFLFLFKIYISQSLTLQINPDCNGEKKWNNQNSLSQF